MKIISSIMTEFNSEDVISLVKKMDLFFEPPLSERVNLKDYVNKICRNGNLELAYTDENKLIGAIAYYCNDLESRYGYITYLGVLPEFQGKGIASKLLYKCITNCQEAGMSKIGVETWKDNTPVLNLYKKFNFHITKEKDNRNNTISVELTKKL